MAADHVRTLLADMRRSRTRASVAVIGSGVIGLTTAAELRRRWRKLPITIYAKDLDVRKTTSFVAGGQFKPSGICDEYDTEDGMKVLADYLRRSRDRIVELQNSSRAQRYGIAIRRDYTLDHDNPAYDDCTPPDVVPTLPHRHASVRQPRHRRPRVPDLADQSDHPAATPRRRAETKRGAVPVAAI